MGHAPKEPNANESNGSNGSSVLYPAFLKLAGRRVLVVGGGPVAAGKIAGLLVAGAVVDVVAPEVLPEIERAGVVIHRREFRSSDVDGAWYVIAAAPPAREPAGAPGWRGATVVRQRRGRSGTCDGVRRWRRAQERRDDRDFDRRTRTGDGRTAAGSARRVAAWKSRQLAGGSRHCAPRVEGARRAHGRAPAAIAAGAESVV